MTALRDALNNNTIFGTDPRYQVGRWSWLLLAATYELQLAWIALICFNITAQRGNSCQRAYPSRLSPCAHPVFPLDQFPLRHYVGPAACLCLCKS